MHSTRWIRVVLADDFPMVRIGIRSLLERGEDIQVVGEAANGEEVLALVRETNPDVLVLDIKMPRMDGVEVVRKLKSESVSLRILALSAYAEKEFVLSLFEIGVDGYLLKDEAPDMIVDAVRSIARGGQGWFSRRVAAALAGYLKDGGNAAQKLTPRERQVLGLVVLGKTNQEIALNLKVSQSTVEKCMIRIYSKLDVTSRVEAAVRAVRDSLV